ncbi:MAG: ABC transporter substrate-binding protein [Actinomycetaceae bacterium]|nr:ABC transporter substrate-binding protein [Actinomycetaceae bacterium]
MAILRRLVAVASAASLFLAGCGSDAGENSNSGSSGTDVTIGLTYVPDVQFAPFYVAVDRGYFADQGVDVTLRHHGAQESFFGALEKGDEDVVVAGGDEMMQARSTGVKVKNWATMYQTYPVRIIVPDDSPIHSPSDLRGKTVGLPGKHGENFFGLTAMLNAEGMTQSDLNVEYIGYTQASALSTGQVDAVLGFVNSDVVAIEAQGVKVRSIELVDGGLPLVSSGLGSTDDFLDSDPQRAEKMRKALGQAVEYMREHPEQTLDIVEKHVPELADPQRRESASKVLGASMELYGEGEFGTQNAQTWQQMSAFMEENELLDAPVPADEAFVDLRQ